MVRAATSDVKELKGLLRSRRERKPAVTVEEMNATIVKEHAGRR